MALHGYILLVWVVFSRHVIKTVDSCEIVISNFQVNDKGIKNMNISFRLHLPLEIFHSNKIKKETVQL